MNQLKEAVIVGYGRSPCCKAQKGAFADARMNAIDYTGQVVCGVLERTPLIRPAMIEDFIFGTAATMNALAMNAGRNIVHRAELPDSVCAITINRYCSTGLQGIAMAANAIKVGEMDVVMVCGAEDMTNSFGPLDMTHANQWILKNRMDSLTPMGVTAENVAERYHVSREEMDEFALESHKKADIAQKTGKLSAGIVPIRLPDGTVIREDEGIRANTSLEALASLKSCFIEEGRVTAGNSSQMTDAAAAAIMTSADKAGELGLKPIARFLGFATAGCAPDEMGIGPVLAVPKLMAKLGMRIEDMNVIELNEAFASQAVYCIRELGLPKEKVNPWGGAIALGHPQGATGIVLSIKALEYLEDTGGKYALVTMCVGGGMGAAGIWEKL
ncbi:MAG: thiolase family protein [Clostridiales Family XIII bacterium]|jgi:acetyl-CoA acyltransferase|nr:thiolase family protein [Clostridiales Family XIII bacterium]